MTIFGQYTPTYERKSYLENQKLFLDISPFFNAKDRDDSTDIDYLFQTVDKVHILDAIYSLFFYNRN
jgi:hypothetical protein